MAETWTIDAVRGAIAAKKISARELTDEFYRRIAARNGELNAYLTLSQERAYAQAAKVDALAAAGKPLPRLEDSGALRAAIRCDGGGAAGSCRGGHPR